MTTYYFLLFVSVSQKILPSTSLAPNELTRINSVILKMPSFNLINFYLITALSSQARIDSSEAKNIYGLSPIF
jgi:hypothetical protein